MRGTWVAIAVVLGAMAGAYLSGLNFFWQYTQQTNWRRGYNGEMIITKEDCAAAAMTGAGAGGAAGWLLVATVAAALDRRHKQALEVQAEAVLADPGTDDVMRDAALLVLASRRGKV